MHDQTHETNPNAATAANGGGAPSSATVDPAAERSRERLRRIPKEVGAVLMTFGVAGLILPGPFGTPLILAGGMILAPRLFDRFERWTERKAPVMHREGRQIVDRFLDDLEGRFPPG